MKNKMFNPTSSLIIESIVPGHSGCTETEYACIYNSTQMAFQCEGWKLIYKDMVTKKILHTHRFYKLHNRSTFAPGERMVLFTERGRDEFFFKGTPSFPVPHWRIFLNRDELILNTSFIEVILCENDTVLASRVCIQGDNKKQLLDVLKSSTTIFIGHGGHSDWKELKDHLCDKHKLNCIFYESEPRSGFTIPDIIQQFGRIPDIALIVMTGEDKTEGGKLRARQNVIHEVGIFQSSLGLPRTIPIVEKGIEIPTNMSGIDELRFNRNCIREIFGDVLAILKREGLY